MRAVGLSEFPTSAKIKAETLANILNFASNNLSDSLFGIKCGLKYPILQYTRPAEFLKLCDNISHAADVYNTYCPIFHTVGVPSGVVSDDGTDRMVWTPNFEQEQTDLYRQFIELIMTNYLTSLNWLAWKTPNAVRQINIKHEATLSIKHYQDLFDCDIKFDQAEYSIILKDGVKDTPFSTSDPAELVKIRMKFDMALNEILQEDSIVDRIELHLRSSIEDGIPNKASAAKALNLSERSMARALQDKGTSFKDIKNRIIQDLAVTKLEQGLPLAEIAHSLGYNDQSAFTRAYKKWYGTTPGKHRTTK